MNFKNGSRQASAKELEKAAYSLPKQMMFLALATKDSDDNFGTSCSDLEETNHLKIQQQDVSNINAISLIGESRDERLA
jgi:hypothetical protein